MAWLAGTSYVTLANIGQLATRHAECKPLALAGDYDMSACDGLPLDILVKTSTYRE